MKQRYIITQDDSGHWYLIKKEDETKFDTVLAKSLKTDDSEEFNDLFDKCRINGPHDLTFTDPCDSNGESLSEKAVVS